MIKAVKFTKRKYQKGLAASIKTSPNSFWNHVKEETKSKSTIGDLKDKDGDLKTEDHEKANKLNDFFSPVFTVEGSSELPEFEQKVKYEDCINQIEINALKVLKQLKSLNVSKSCGPDNCNPFCLKVCAEQIYLPLTNIFQKSLSRGVIPDDWKKANITCLFEKEINRILETIGSVINLCHM